MKTIDELVEWEYTMELQNLDDRLGANEAFKEGIRVGINAMSTRNDKLLEALKVLTEDIIKNTQSNGNES